MITEKKFCRRCHKKRIIHNKSRGWCRACMAKLNDRFIYTKVLPHPDRYDDILNMAKDGFLTQKEIAAAVGRSLTGTQGIISRYTVKVDKEGNEKPR